MAAAVNSKTTEPTLSEVLTEVRKDLAEVKETQATQQKAFEALSKPRENGSNLFNIREGENPLTSRGYSFLKLFGAMSKVIPWEQAKVERDLHETCQKRLVTDGHFKKAEANSVVAPVSSIHLADAMGDDRFGLEVRQVLKAGIHGYDPMEVRHYRNKYWTREKALSWIDETTGGALVAPPQMGELIELLRNNECLIQAGARDIGMPPNGRITFPRQTSATTAYFIGESTAITDSTPGTGDLLLSAKKLAVLCKIPNELFRFSSISVEQFVRDDIAQVMALRLDKALLEDVGSNTTPKGLIQYSNINTIRASTTGVNYDTYQPQDVMRMISAVEEVNATFKSWIMRPVMFSAISQRRSDAASPGDQAGPFVFNLLREMGDDMLLNRGKSGSLAGYPVVKSTQVSKLRPAYGSSTASTNTYILGGDFSDFIIALGGVIEFVTSTQGDTPLSQDQTWIRGIQYVDGGPRHEASFVLCDNLQQA